MFNALSLATGGLYPGLVTPFSIAMLGSFDVEVIIEPVILGGGGGYVPAPRWQKPDRYRVTVRVYHNGKRYEETAIVDDNEARVMARMNGIEKFSEDEVMVSFNGIQVNKSNPIITITK